MGIEAPSVVAVRCNPYGHGTDRGPRHLFGGLFSTAYEGHIKWQCPTPADGRFIMYCPHGHQGEPIRLCYGHVAMITSRMSGVCTRCAMPPEAREVWEDTQRYAGMAGRAKQAGDYDEYRRLVAKLEDLGRLSVEQVQRGIVRKTPMRLREIS